MAHLNALQNLDCSVKFVWPSEWDFFDNANFSYDFGWQKQSVVLSVQLSYFIRDCMRTPQRNITHCSRWSQTLKWCLWSSLNSIACINEANGNRVNANRYGSYITSWRIATVLEITSRFHQKACRVSWQIVIANS